MKPLQTVKGNLNKFNNYYDSFLWLLSNKTDLTYLGYPFIDINTSDTEFINFRQFTLLLDTPSTIYNKETMEWVYKFIINAFTNEHQHDLAKFILYRTRYKNFHSNNQTTRLLKFMHRIVLVQEKHFAKVLRNDNPTEWRPNT